MVNLSSLKVVASLALASVTVILAACGGSSDGSGGISSSGASRLFAESSGNSLATVSPPQTAPPDTKPTILSAVLPSATSASASDLPSATDSSTGPTGQDPNNFTLTFDQTFDGELDPKVWNTQRTDSADSTTNYATGNGSLKIWPERGPSGAFFKRTLDTDGHFMQRYGYFEMEAKLPKGKGSWPAFWLFNQLGERRPEIDILEAYPGGEAPWGQTGSDNIPTAVMYAPVVWTNGGERAGYAKVATPDLSAGFHRYGLKWEPARATFYFDGREVYSLDVAVSDPLYIMLTLWFGSASGEPDASTPAGAGNAFEINYVKAWQFK